MSPSGACDHARCVSLIGVQLVFFTLSWARVVACLLAPPVCTDHISCAYTALERSFEETGVVVGTSTRSDRVRRCAGDGNRGSRPQYGGGGGADALVSHGVLATTLASTWSRLGSYVRYFVRRLDDTSEATSYFPLIVLRLGCDRLLGPDPTCPSETRDVPVSSSPASCVASITGSLRFFAVPLLYGTRLSIPGAVLRSSSRCFEVTLELRV